MFSTHERLRPDDIPSWEDLLERVRVLAVAPLRHRLLPVWRVAVQHDRYQAELTECARRELLKTRSPLQWAEDVEQEAIVLLARDLHHVEHVDSLLQRVENFPGWIRTVTSRGCQQAIRRMQRLHDPVISADSAVLDREVDLQADIEDLIDLDLAIERLETPYRHAVVLRFNGRSIAEISRSLRVSPRNGYRMLGHGVHVLRRWLSKGLDDRDH